MQRLLHENHISFNALKHSKVILNGKYLLKTN